MDLAHSTTKRGVYKHLSFQERVHIEIRLKDGKKPCAIAKELGRAKNTILSEIKRGTVPQKNQGKTCHLYLADAGQAIYEKHRSNCKPGLKLETCKSFIDYVEAHYDRKSMSLDAIHGYIKRNHPDMKRVCTKTLYNYVDQGLLRIKNIDLLLKTKRNHKQASVRKNLKKLGTSIEERPDLSGRETFGHWEIDTVIGLKKKEEACILTLVERQTRFQICLKIAGKYTDAVNAGVQTLRKDYGSRFSKVFKTITSDNGSEFSGLSQLETISDTKVYYTHPYSSWERGSNERHNGILRRFLPKGKSLSALTQEELDRMTDQINAMPRRILNYQTPEELFEETLDVIYAS